MRQITVDTSEVRGCAKCLALGRAGATTPPLYRHHMGFDSLLGWYNRAIRFNYHRYLDCVILCYEHHLEIHVIYQPTSDKWVNRTPKGAMKVRKVFIGICKRWLEGKIPTPKIPKDFALKFKVSLEEWEKTHDGRTPGSR